MQVCLTDKAPRFAVAGHAGCGHCNSHKGYLQEDSVGLAAVLALFQEATGVSLVIRDVRVQCGLQNFIEVETMSGGIGRASARRGIAFHEAGRAKALIGKEAVRTQTIVAEAFGRFYGQGVNETPVALQTAVANAAIDSFVRNFPAQFVWARESTAGSCGLMAGTVLDFDGVPTAVLATVNASEGGIGPNEDLEGNCAAGSKGRLMEKLRMTALPTVVVEGKVYWPALSDQLEETRFLVRAAAQDDNVAVAEALYAAAEALGYAARLDTQSIARGRGILRAQTKALGEKIAALGINLQRAEFSQEKVAVLAELAKLVSEDGAGISFMSNALHERIGGVGMNPGSSAVLSRVVPRAYHEAYVMPFATEQDVRDFVAVVKAAVVRLPRSEAHAREICARLDCTADLDALILEGDVCK